ncbi:alpha-amylase family protein [Paenibacillus eucommiae]|uniref:Beta-galactosidase trimerisation domain-containing protein n=1 Tax=Paenibacillus eucommiae TaxID=1355755 RepID=A0ABS4J109_9BACL|nr:alpha-amylase family protein [Paenibacillus eucommiae]MBP1993527.1 hypothetical protein [Paenibacillus eucommiae]
MGFRQVHLDFHTSEAIAEIGRRFSKKQFQNMLELGHIDSITVFAKCHHGWSYHPTKVNEMHPNLDFDLLGAMIEAAAEVGVQTPIYISAGLDERLARQHPEWLIRDMDDRTNWVAGFMEPGFHQFCMNSPYLPVLLEQIAEIVSNYETNYIFFDIVGVRQCYCHSCVKALREVGKDPQDAEAIRELGERTYAHYTEQVRQTIHSIKPNMGIVHNSGLLKGRRDLIDMSSHLELESLPTGGWGYDHFPLSARYVQQLGIEFVGMTGKFHTTWGEFGGYKHPNALKYETALNLANGARCSIGDQLHPDGLMDQVTYQLIGQAYGEVKEKEVWCSQAKNVADVGLLSVEAFTASGSHPQQVMDKSDIGAVRLLLEGKFLFDVIDLESDFNSYKVIILPDQIYVDAFLKHKLEVFFEKGGKVLATGSSGLNKEKSAFAIDLGVRYVGLNQYQPDYLKPAFEMPNFSHASLVCYSQGIEIDVVKGSVLGKRENPYFNRELFRYCSHQHTPSSKENGGPGVVESTNGIYIAWHVFDDYAKKGSLPLKEIIIYALNLLLPDKTLETNLPAQGVVTLQKQDQESRYVQHLLYAAPVLRGENIEVIEDIVPVHDIEVSLILESEIKRVYLAPQMQELVFEKKEDRIRYMLPVLECHQMVVLDWDADS